MGFFDKLKGIASNGAANLIEKAGQAVDSLITSAEEREKLKIELQKTINEHEQKMAELQVRETEGYLKDIDSARQMQIEALKQDDKFAKRFIYYLATFVIISATLFGCGLFFFEPPKDNKRLIEMFADLYMFAGGMMVLSFFFGSSKSSGEKTSALVKMMSEK